MDTTNKYGLVAFEDDDLADLVEYSTTMNEAITEALDNNKGEKGDKGDKGDIGSIGNRYHLTLEEEIEDNSEIEIPCYYEVGNDSLQVYFEGELLEKDIHYEEIRRR